MSAGRCAHYARHALAFVLLAVAVVGFYAALALLTLALLALTPALVAVTLGWLAARALWTLRATAAASAPRATCPTAPAP